MPIADNERGADRFTELDFWTRGKNEEIIKEMVALHEKVEGIYGYRQMTLNTNR